MKPVNLLPAADRPVKAVKAPANASAIVLGVLGALVLLVGAFVYTHNRISSAKTETATAQQRAAAAKVQAGALQSFADFRQIKQTREASVKQLATQRFDWERFLRELSLVLPDKVWLTTMAGTAGGSDPSSASTPGAAAGAAGASSSASSGAAQASVAPSIKLSGCAPSHQEVATTLVRLRGLDAVESVDLQDSTKGDSSSTTASSGSQSPSGSNSSAACRGYAFDATVNFSENQASDHTDSKPVPRRLGGGA